MSYWSIVLYLQEEMLKATTIREEDRLEKAIQEVLNKIENLSEEGE